MSFRIMLRYGFRFSPDDVPSSSGDGNAVNQTPPDEGGASNNTPDFSDASTAINQSHPFGSGQQPASDGGSGSASAATGGDQSGHTGHSQFSAKNFLAEQGYDVSSIPDDKSAVETLLRLGQRANEYQSQLQQYQPYYDQMRTHWSDWQEFLKNRQQQQAPAQQPQQQQDPWWKPFYQEPEFDERWERQITQDPETGEFKLQPGSPPDTLDKYLRYREHVAQQARQFWKNPIAYMEKPMEALAQQVAEKVFREQANQMQTQQFVSSWTQQNSNWLYQRDQNGQVLYQNVFDPNTGSYVPQPVLSDYGQRFKYYVEDAMRRGYDVHGQRDYALALVQRDYALATQQPQNGQTHGQTQNGQPPAVQQPAPNAPTNGLQNVPGNPAPGQQATRQNAEPEPVGSLADQLRAEFKKQGITDADLR